MHTATRHYARPRLGLRRAVPKDPAALLDVVEFQHLAGTHQQAAYQLMHAAGAFLVGGSLRVSRGGCGLYATPQAAAAHAAKHRVEVDVEAIFEGEGSTTDDGRLVTTWPASSQPKPRQGAVRRWDPNTDGIGLWPLDDVGLTGLHYTYYHPGQARRFWQTTTGWLFCAACSPVVEAAVPA